MNDELRDVSDELALRNRSLQERTGQLDDTRSFFQSVLDSVDTALATVDAGLRVLTWNAGAEELWGVRADEVEGESLLGLDIGLPLERFAEPIRAVVHGEVEEQMIELPAHNRRGRWITCCVRCSPLRPTAAMTEGAVIVMEPLASDDG